ncbi:decaprenyl-phosphate phosphoribosyltransferase [Thiothrix fructosivorans]|jgi:4-hydroxybenzoate polyprenyltransferase|uniref:Decaprenyl-phosphate phosphoribosyltransferase n=2 Tax=Thiothrix fructosivorans TaxID=111770 RepID=A0A8B0SSZ5_9GAMM|nr:decaprenyl-phosphate phosphoribosyltransferase [Thiothrix fructosivorans]QTX12807.1 decaprenyl-phosphate phosphoribosyltransferase [Thiothrix fructosivorans]
MLSLPPKLRALLRLMRPRQWIKNAFVLAPLLFAGEFLHIGSVVNALGAVVLFCMASSAVYIVNDWRDVERDRQHPLKSKTRPLASGDVSQRAALRLLIVLGVLVSLGGLVMPKVGLVILTYVVINLTYTFWLKHEPVLDIFTIASGFVLRVYAGGMALDVPVSGWMFVTTLCLALYLASVKRRQELLQSGIDGRKVLEKYSVVLVERYAEMSATGALIFYSLFIMSEKPSMIMTIPVVLFGLFRYWYVVDMLEGGESPTDALFSDRQLQLVVIIWVSMCTWLLMVN